MDWQFFVDFNAPVGAVKTLSSEEIQQLERVSFASQSVQNTQGQDKAAWDALAAALRKGRELEIPNFQLEESSGLRGQFMVELMDGKADVQSLYEKATE